MKERPILFSTEMVKAILEGRKSQTRRVVTSKTSEIGEGGDWAKLCWDGSAVYKNPELANYIPIKKQEKSPMPFVDDGFWKKDHSAPMYLHVPCNWEDDMTVYRVYCRYDVGDRLWIRRSKEGKFIWKKALAEIWLEITGIRVERVQEITEDDAIEEGCIAHNVHIVSGIGVDPTIGRIGYKSARMLYQELWDSLNVKLGYSWEANPWVWVVSFKKVAL